MALSDTLVKVASFHDLALASGFTWYITWSPTDGREALAFIGSLLFNCPAMDSFLSDKISWVSLLGCTSEMLEDAKDIYLTAHIVLASWHSIECSYSLMMLT